MDFRTADDAGVYALDHATALVQTVDFFTPIVDDAYAYGSIAAANALSDVYAMGGTPLTALAIACLPKRGFDLEQARAIFLGGLETLRSAGVALLGGHTVQDEEVKFGYAVTGILRPGSQWANTGARPGDLVLLTKPLGTGVVSTAVKSGHAPTAAVEAAIASMRALNREAADLLREEAAGVVGGCTDVTGFGLVGHACEMAMASGVQLRLQASALPVLPGARDLAVRYQPGGTASNAAHFGSRVRFEETVDSVTRALCHDPQTSGGLLVTVRADRAAPLLAAMVGRGIGAALVGSVHVADQDGAAVVVSA